MRAGAGFREAGIGKYHSQAASGCLLGAILTPVGAGAP